MAANEACSDYVDKTIEECQAGDVQGESLLIPLDGVRLSVPELEQTADSGTESGEDLRSGLIIEVQNALDKLSACLSDDSTDITTERRNSLLQLVTKLQANLSSGQNSNTNHNPERRYSGHSRFSKRKPRPTRHTVGVTSEELEDARKLMEEFALRESTNPAYNTPLKKQNSESSVQSYSTIFKPVKFQPNQTIKNAMPKPYTSTSNSQSHSSTSSAADTPIIDCIELLNTEKEQEFDYFANPTISLPHQNITLCEETLPDLTLHAAIEQPSHDYILDYAASNIEDDDNIPMAKNDYLDLETETDEESTIRSPKQLKDGERVVLYDESAFLPKPTYVLPQTETYTKENLFRREETKPDLILQTNPLYTSPQNEEFQVTDSDKARKFNSKKLKMKRANTIDIPKPLKFYQTEDEDDYDYESANEDINSRRMSYLALRGPIRVGKNTNTSKVPTFEPKTESDKKFLAFLNKQNEVSSVSNKISLWDKNNVSSNTGNVWNKKFDNIKSSLVSTTPKTENKGINNARNFWKSADDTASAVGISYNGPRISKQNARNLQKMFEEKQKQTKYNSLINENKNIVSGSLRVDTKNLEPNKSYKFVPQPLTTNKFSHNPKSAFQPVQKETRPENIKIITSSSRASNSNSDTSQPETPLYLYSPKFFEHSNGHSQTPWSSNVATSERRVLTLAASKFEKPQLEEYKIKPRKLSSEKISNPFLYNNEQADRLPAYIAPQNVTNRRESTVKKLSGQYNTPQNNSPTVLSDVNSFNHKRPLHQSAFAPVPQTKKQPSFAKKIEGYNENPNHQYKNFDNSNYVAKKENLGNIYQKYCKPKSPLSDIPPSFHTTSPQVQNLQKIHKIVSTPLVEDSPHVYYNNVQGYSNNAQYETHDDNSRNDGNLYNVKSNLVETAYVPYSDSTSVKPTVPVNPIGRPSYESQVSQESLHEYNAINSRVMSAPIGQQAVTVQQNQPKTRYNHDMDNALKNSLQRVDKNLRVKSPNLPINQRESNQQPEFQLNNKPIESHLINDEGQSIVISKFQIPMKTISAEKYQKPTQRQVLSKCDSWHNICQDNPFQSTKKPSPRASPNVRSLTKSKSTHALAIPKQFEAGMSRDEVVVKKKTVEAYFSGQKSPQFIQDTSNKNSSKRSINRLKTSEKVSVSNHSTGLCRSRTLPDIVCQDMLDETNVDAAFEDLFKAST